MKENCIKLVHRHKSSVISCRTSCFRTQIVKERLTTKTQIIFFATICFIPEQNIFQLVFSSILLSIRIKIQIYVITIIIDQIIVL